MLPAAVRGARQSNLPVRTRISATVPQTTRQHDDAGSAKREEAERRREEKYLAMKREKELSGGYAVGDLVKSWQGDINKLSNPELLKLQSHKNDWFVRHARRVLQERQADTSGLTKILKSDGSVPLRLRALWALRVTGHLKNETLANFH